MARQFHWHEIRRRRKARAGKNSFPQPPSFLPARAFSFDSAARSAAIRDFVQKRFERRSVIATNKDILKIEKDWIARSPRLRRVSLRKKPVVSGLNQTAGKARRGLVWKAGGGSELRSNSSRICGISNFFLSAFGGIRASFFNPALYGQRRLTTNL